MTRPLSAVRRSAEAPGQADEPRRRSRRFDERSITVKAALVEVFGDRIGIREFAVRDISCGGMCLWTDAAFEPGCERHFIILVVDPLSQLALARARVVWSRREGERSRTAFEFVESSVGWLGPDDTLEKAA